jgi:hypothetical protein
MKSSPPLSTGLIQPSPSRTSIQHSSLTLDGKYDDPFVGPSNAAAAPAEKPKTELAGARTRLRPVSERRERLNGTTSDNLTIAELGSILDSAIIEQSSNASPVKSNLASPQSPLSRLRIARTSQRGYSQSLRNNDRLATAREQRTRPATATSDYPTSSPIKSPQSIESPHSPLKFPQQSQNKSPAYSRASIGIPDRCVSPVKQRAAMFESLSSSPPDSTEPSQPPPKAHLHHKEGWVTIPGHFPTPEVEAGLHRLKFGRSIDMHSDTVEASTSRDTEAYETAHESDMSPVRQAPPRNGHRRAPSRGWPTHTPVSSKTGIAYPQQTEEAASPSARDAHYPPARPSIVSQRIAQLALAGLECEQVPNRSRSVANSRSRYTSATSAMVGEDEIREHGLDGGVLRPRLLAQLQVQIQEEADSVRSNPQEYGNPDVGQHATRNLLCSRDAAQTPVSLGMYEKQAVSTSRKDLSQVGEGGPSTPARGRSQVKRTPRSSGYGVEQSFYFSPTRSRSQSKASGRRLTLEINLGTPDKEAMEKVVIKADMDVLNEHR